MDSDRLVGDPPKGSGRFLGLLADAGMLLVPVGILEVEGTLRVSFGAPFVPAIPAAREQIDEAVSGRVMQALVRELYAAREGRNLAPLADVAATRAIPAM